MELGYPSALKLLCNKSCSNLVEGGKEPYWPT